MDVSRAAARSAAAAAPGASRSLFRAIIPNSNSVGASANRSMMASSFFKTPVPFSPDSKPVDVSSQRSMISLALAGAGGGKSSTAFETLDLLADVFEDAALGLEDRRHVHFEPGGHVVAREAIARQELECLPGLRPDARPARVHASPTIS